MKWAVCLLALAANHLWACDCLLKLSLCQEVSASSMVFIGKVESVYPWYLDSSNRGRATELLGEVSALHSEPAPDTVPRLKKLYLEMLGAAPDRVRADIEKAGSVEELDRAFDQAVAQGEQAKVSVGRNFAMAADDDEPKDTAAAGASGSLAVWTGTDDCGVGFQTGETYLIYAGADEQTGKLETSICNRTRRLSDAAADLGYLFYVGLGEDRTVRIEGRLAAPHEASQTVPGSEKTDDEGAMAGLAISLGGAAERYTRTGTRGEFLFDGLKRGQYTLTVYAGVYPRRVIPLAEPLRIEVGDKSCATPVVTMRPGWRALVEPFR